MAKTSKSDINTGGREAAAAVCARTRIAAVRSGPYFEDRLPARRSLGSTLEVQTVAGRLLKERPMRCPYCGGIEDRVVDSRESKEGDVIRRRRQCVACERRFTSYEKIESVPFQVVKRDERREPYDREKLMRGLRVACRKRPISSDALESLADSIETEMQESSEREISSRELGRMVMQRLRELDEVAYVRFASVYRRFEDVEEFVRELHELKEPEK